MDLANIRKKIDDEMLTYEIQKGITQFRNAAKNQEIDQDVATSDFFKTLSEPLIEQQKKTDEKQDKIIKQLEKNQKAIENALEFPQLPLPPPPGFSPTFEELAAKPKASLSAKSDEEEFVSPDEEEKSKKVDVLEIDMDKAFTEDERKILEVYEKSSGLIPLNSLKDKSPKEIELARKTYDKIRKNFITTPSSVLKQAIERKKDQKEDYSKEQKELETLHTKGEVLSKYKRKTTLLLDAHKVTVKKGKGHTKRHAYKIQDKHFGKLMIDVPKLMNEMKLDAFRGGNLVYQADADRSLIDLLTKRFNPKKPVSLNAARVFNDLVMLANLSKHPSSGKSSIIGSSVIAYSKPEDLIKRIDVLMGAMAAGNTSHVIRNDLSMVIDELLKIGAIDQDMHRKFYDRYLK